MNFKVGTINPPDIPKNLPLNSKWLSGQGVGAWFSIEVTNENTIFRIKRYTPEGNLDCDRIFKIAAATMNFDINQPYEFKHISHCSKCKIEQDGVVFEFNYIEA